MKTRLPGWILWKSDRLSMAHGVEARVPFLDHPLVELLARMPPNLKLNGLNEKYVLKQCMTPGLPEMPHIGVGYICFFCFAVAFALAAALGGHMCLLVVRSSPALTPAPFGRWTALKHRRLALR